MSQPSKYRNHQTIHQTATTLEHLLYQHSQKSIKTYQDLSTLDSRLRGLMTILVRRRIMKRTGQSKKRISSGGSSGCHNTRTIGDGTPTGREIPFPRARTRSQILWKILGKSKYKEIEQLLQEIRLAKMKKVASFCGSNQCTTSLRLCGKTFDTQLPQVVRQLYFETPLIDCFERYPLEKLPHLPWQVLLDQAQSNLLAYKLWELELNTLTTTNEC